MGKIIQGQNNTVQYPILLRYFLIGSNVTELPTSAIALLLSCMASNGCWERSMILLANDAQQHHVKYLAGPINLNGQVLLHIAKSVLKITIFEQSELGAETRFCG